MNHFAARARHDGVTWIGEFRCAEHADFLAAGAVDLLGELEENRFNGRSSLQFLIRDARPAS